MPRALAVISRPWVRWEARAYLKGMDALIPAAEDPQASFDSFLKAKGSWLEARSRCDATRWALAVLQHRMKTGKLPATLDEIPTDLIPDRPLDPWTPGKPFVYRPEADGSGFAVYSLGRNCIDDGGEFEKTDPETRQPIDIGVRWKVR